MTRKQIIWTVTAFLYGSFLFYVLWLPKDSLPVSKLLSPDKIYHAGAYFVLTLIVYITLLKYDINVLLLGKWALGLCIIHASLSEFFQKFSPGRSSGWDDWVANLVGIFIAFMFIRIAVGRKKRL